jgi:hypothetical protein
MTTPADEGLEMEQVVSCGRNPLPLTEISEPTLPDTKVIMGEDSTFIRFAVPTKAKQVKRSNMAANFMGRSAYHPASLGIIAYDQASNGPFSS